MSDAENIKSEGRHCILTYSQPPLCLQSVTLVLQPPETQQDMSLLVQRNCLDGLPEPATNGQRTEKPTDTVSCARVSLSTCVDGRGVRPC